MESTKIGPFKDINDMAKFLAGEQTTNLNELIEAVNSISGDFGGDKVRREKYSPFIYAVVLNKPKFKIGDKEVKLVKVGFTQRETKRDTNNRMEEVENDIKKSLSEKYPGCKIDPSTVIVLLIGPLDTTKFRDTEDRIREQMGYPLPKKEAKQMGLPVPTEWAITTQDFIDRINWVKDKFKKEEPMSTKIFSSKYFTKREKPPGLNEEKLKCDLVKELKLADDKIIKAEIQKWAEEVQRKALSTPESQKPKAQAKKPKEQVKPK